MMFARYTDRSRASVEAAFEEARMLGHDSLGDEDLLLGILRADEGMAAEALASLGVTLEGAREESEGMLSDALFSIGVSLEDVRREAGDAFDMSISRDRKISYSPRAKDALVSCPQGDAEAGRRSPRRRARAARDLGQRGRHGRQDAGSHGRLARGARREAVRSARSGGRLMAGLLAEGGGAR